MILTWDLGNKQERKGFGLTVLHRCQIDKRSVVLVSFCPLDKLESPGKRGPQLLNWLYQVGLGHVCVAYSWFFLLIWEGTAYCEWCHHWASGLGRYKIGSWAWPESKLVSTFLHSAGLCSCWGFCLTSLNGQLILQAKWTLSFSSCFC